MENVSPMTLIFFSVIAGFIIYAIYDSLYGMVVNMYKKYKMMKLGINQPYHHVVVHYECTRCKESKTIECHEVIGIAWTYKNDESIMATLFSYPDDEKLKLIIIPDSINFMATVALEKMNPDEGTKKVLQAIVDLIPEDMKSLTKRERAK